MKIITVGDYLKKADEALAAASSLSDNFLSYKNSIAMLTSWATELYLKSFLFNKGISVDAIKKQYNHDIRKLYDACEEQDALISKTIDTDLIDLINTYNLSFGGVRYIDPNTTGYAFRTDTFEQLQNIIEYIKNHTDNQREVKP